MAAWRGRYRTIGDYKRSSFRMDEREALEEGEAA